MILKVQAQQNLIVVFKTMIKKVRSVHSSLSTLTAANSDVVVQSLDECNLSNFMAETIENIMQANIKIDDVPSFVRVASILALKYGDAFVKSFTQQIFDTIKGEDTSAPRRRTILCVLADLIIIHVLPSSKPLSIILSKLIDDDIRSLKFENDSYIWRIFHHCGADLVGVNFGPNTIMDPIFPVKECICPELRKSISSYYNTIIEQIKTIAETGMDAREDHINYSLKWVNSTLVRQKKHSIAKMNARNILQWQRNMVS